jgi:hypothetical protein
MPSTDCEVLSGYDSLFRAPRVRFLLSAVFESHAEKGIDDCGDFSTFAGLNSTHFCDFESM